MMMAAREHDCVLCATTTALATSTITQYGKVILCMRGVMGLQVVWGTAYCEGVGILEIVKNVWAERRRVQASY